MVQGVQEDREVRETMAQVGQDVRVVQEVREAMALADPGVQEAEVQVDQEAQMGHKVDRQEDQEQVGHQVDRQVDPQVGQGRVG